jgi:NADH:ubiquinone reductase (non-electrogenic)
MRMTLSTVSCALQVTAVRETEMYLSNGQALPYGVCLWSAGNCSRQITRDIFGQVEGQQPYKARREAQQKVAVDNYLRVVGTKNVFAAGDCARLVEGPLPPTAQVRPHISCLFRLI